ncbi:MAG: ribosome maturation factor, partial [Pseudomonadota bacterium]
AVEGQKRFRGVLAGVEENAVCLDIDGEAETALIPMAWIADAKLILTDELIAESLKAAKRSSEQEVKPDSSEQPNGDRPSGEQFSEKERA